MGLRNKMIIQIAYIAELYELQILSIDFRIIGPMVDEVKITYKLNNAKFGISHLYRNNTMLEVNFLMQKFKEEVEKLKSKTFNSEVEQIEAAIMELE